MVTLNFSNSITTYQKRTNMTCFASYLFTFVLHFLFLFLRKIIKQITAHISVIFYLHYFLRLSPLLNYYGMVVPSNVGNIGEMKKNIYCGILQRKITFMSIALKGQKVGVHINVILQMTLQPMYPGERSTIRGHKAYQRSVRWVIWWQLVNEMLTWKSPTSEWSI